MLYSIVVIFVAQLYKEVRQFDFIIIVYFLFIFQKNLSRRRYRRVQINWCLQNFAVKLTTSFLRSLSVEAKRRFPLSFTCQTYCLCSWIIDATNHHFPRHSAFIIIQAIKILSQTFHRPFAVQSVAHEGELKTAVLTVRATLRT